jgi:ABC-type multidrug transport system fused ATPase/permease subunit
VACVCSCERVHLQGEEIAVKLRSRLFNSVLSKDVPFYDRHTSGDLTSRLSADITLVQVGSSEKVGILVASMGQCLAGIVVAFVYGWKMTLVLLSTTPLLAFSFVFFSRLMMGSSSTGQDSYAEANTIAGEAMSGFRTVISFGREAYEGERFWESLQTTWRYVHCCCPVLIANSMTLHELPLSLSLLNS